MYCSNCGKLCKDEDLYCISCGNKIKNSRKDITEKNMKEPITSVKNTKHILRFTVILGVIIILGIVCIVISRKLFLNSKNTDVYGTWERETIDNFGNKNVQKYIFNTDGTGYFEETSYDDGTVLSDNKKNLEISYEKINSDIDHVIAQGDERESGYTYKYKDMLGYYTKISVPDGKKFDLSLSSNKGNISSIYRKDGTYHICLNYDSCKNDDCGGCTYKYKRKGNKILFQETDGGKWEEYTYIVQGGIFTKWYTKSNDK